MCEKQMEGTAVNSPLSDEMNAHIWRGSDVLRPSAGVWVQGGSAAIPSGPVWPLCLHQKRALPQFVAAAAVIHWTSRNILKALRLGPSNKSQRGRLLIVRVSGARQANPPPG